MNVNVFAAREAGYLFLLKKLQVNSIDNWHRSWVSSNSKSQIDAKGLYTDEVYRKQYWPGDDLGDHLVFALKYDGINLSLLSDIFARMLETGLEQHLAEYITTRPTGKYTRKLWFLYEFMTKQQLPIDALQTGNYEELLENEKYYVAKEPQKISRQRINNNLLGCADFCPIIRKTNSLQTATDQAIKEKCERIVNNYSEHMLHRALSYFYKKETKSSFEIEKIKPSSSRTERFIKSLELAEREDFVNKKSLIELQNQIVDVRFKEQDYRQIQNYVGQTVAYNQELVHYVSPQPKDLHKLMSGLITTHTKLQEQQISPVVHAAVIAYGFVFMHPFEDGNGRIHRFLIHNILATRKLVPRGLMFPVSAVMLKHNQEYDASLEAFSKALLAVIDYELDDKGKLSLKQETSHYYKYIDMTFQVESLYRFIEKTIDEELVTELDFLQKYDRTFNELQGVVDMPDRLLNLFIKLSLQNKGKLSENKRAAHFDFLTNSELGNMQTIVKKYMV